MFSHFDHEFFWQIFKRQGISTLHLHLFPVAASSILLKLFPLFYIIHHVFTYHAKVRCTVHIHM